MKPCNNVGFFSNVTLLLLYTKFEPRLPPPQKPRPNVDEIISITNFNVIIMHMRREQYVISEI